MLKLFKVLEGALSHLEEEQGIDPNEVHEVEVELCTIGQTHCGHVNFPDHNYMAFTYSSWREGDFIGVKV